MEEHDYEDLLSQAIDAALQGGKEILEVYNSDFAVEHKDDKSPLTEADKRAHNKIVEVLEDTNLPLLSEEGKDIPYEERSEWDEFWMVDPLDGTKEFVKRNGEFTVNIALIMGRFSYAGVIYVPVKNTLYFGMDGFGAYKVENVPAEGKMQDIDEWVAAGTPLPMARPEGPIRVVGSRSHMNEDTEKFVGALEKKYGAVEIVSMGSSLKICLVAEGSADVYPRLAPTMEWDTAAGQAIATAAGMEVLNAKTKMDLLYNKENLLNDWFLVKASND